MKNKIVAMMAAFLALSACASLNDRSAEALVTERAQLRLDLLTSGGWQEAYLLASPNFRATTPVRMYSSLYGGAVNWITANVKRVECPGETPMRCDVLTEVTYRAISGGFIMPRVLEETWIYVDDNWYMFEE